MDRAQRRLALGLALCAISQGGLLSACGTKATLVRNRSSALKTEKTSGPAAAGTASAPATADTLSFVASIVSVDFDTDTARDSASLGFSHWPTPAQISTLGPVTAPLSAAVKTGGTDMAFPAAVTGYSAQLSCKATDCKSATVTLSKTQAPRGGKATILIERSVPENLTLNPAGTLTGVQARVAAALQSQGASQGSIDKRLSLSRLDNGAVYFKIDCRVPRGAIVPSQAPGDAGRRIVLSGWLGAKTTVSMSYYDTEGDLSAGTHEEQEGSAVFTGADQTIRLTFEGGNRIRAMAFGNFRI